MHLPAVVESLTLYYCVPGLLSSTSTIFPENFALSFIWKWKLIVSFDNWMLSEFSSIILFFTSVNRLRWDESPYIYQLLDISSCINLQHYGTHCVMSLLTSNYFLKWEKRSLNMFIWCDLISLKLQKISPTGLITPINMVENIYLIRMISMVENIHPIQMMILMIKWVHVQIFSLR